MGNAIPLCLSRRDAVVFRDIQGNGRLSLKRIRNIEQSSEDLLSFSVGSGAARVSEKEHREERAVDVGVEEEDLILGLELHVDSVSCSVVVEERGGV